MRRFSAEYLRDTRDGMWDDSQDALAGLNLETRERVLDVGAGTGELTRVLRASVPGEVLAFDADRELLSHIDPPRIQGDATRLPFNDGAFDLVVCQALLVNLPTPESALAEFARASRDRVAVIEPDNSAVSIDSTVDTESPLARRARDGYLDGVSTDAALGEARELFDRVGLTDITVRQYNHTQEIAPPYSKRALESARMKASGRGLERDRETILAGDTTPDEFDHLREEWRKMGRDVIEQMQDETYRHRQTVPFYVTTGRVSRE